MEYDVSTGYHLNRHVDVTMAKKEAEEERRRLPFLIIPEENEVKVKKKEDSDIFSTLTLFF